MVYWKKLRPESCRILRQMKSALLNGKTWLKFTRKKRTALFLKKQNWLIWHFIWQTLKNKRWILWNFLNTISPDAAKHTKDPDCKKFTNPNNHCLNFLLQMAAMFKEMDKSIHSHHIWGLTSETAPWFQLRFGVKCLHSTSNLSWNQGACLLTA